MALENVLDLVKTEFPRPLDNRELPKFLLYLCEKTNSEVRGIEIGRLHIVTPEPGHEYGIDHGSYYFEGMLTRIRGKNLNVEMFQMNSHQSKLNCLGSLVILHSDDESNDRRNLEYRKEIKSVISNYFSENKTEF